VIPEVDWEDSEKGQKNNRTREKLSLFIGTNMRCKSNQCCAFDPFNDFETPFVEFAYLWYNIWLKNVVLLPNGWAMKNALQKIAIAWIAILGLIGLGRDRSARNEEKELSSPQQQEVLLDEYEMASFHNN
jgi:hypothetical protein